MIHSCVRGIGGSVALLASIGMGVAAQEERALFDTMVMSGVLTAGLLAADGASLPTVLSSAIASVAAYTAPCYVTIGASLLTLVLAAKEPTARLSCCWYAQASHMLAYLTSLAAAAECNLVKEGVCEDLSSLKASSSWMIPSSNQVSQLALGSIFPLAYVSTHNTGRGPLYLMILPLLGLEVISSSGIPNRGALPLSLACGVLLCRPALTRLTSMLVGAISCATLASGLTYHSTHGCDEPIQLGCACALLGGLWTAIAALSPPPPMPPPPLDDGRS
jgi:hypothetical protein